MIGLIYYFFFVFFLVGFGRFLLELLIMPRNEFLFKLSVGMMGASVVFFFLLYCLRRLEHEYQVPFLSQTGIFLVFLVGIGSCAWIGFLWLKRLK